MPYSSTRSAKQKLETDKTVSHGQAKSEGRKRYTNTDMCFTKSIGSEDGN